jgi:hypothetical protein
VNEEGVDMPTATGEARIEIDATALTVDNLVSDSNCMVQSSPEGYVCRR